MAKRLTPEEKAERAAAREAKAKADRDAYVKKLVDAAPEPSLEQIVLIRRLLNLDRPDSEPRKPSAYELEQRRKQRERDDALREAKKLAESLTACDVCNLQPEAHYMQKANAVGFHDWEPGRAEKVMKRG